MKKLVLFVCIVILASSVSAQEVDKIGFMLELQEKLNLSKGQIDQLMALRMDLKKFHINQNAKRELEKVALDGLFLNREKNLSEIKAKYDEMALLSSAEKYAAIEAEVKALKILDEKQRQEFGAFLEKWHHDRAQKKKHVEIEVEKHMKCCKEKGEECHKEGHEEAHMEKHMEEHIEEHMEGDEEKHEVIIKKEIKEGDKVVHHEMKKYNIEELLEKIKKLEAALEAEKAKNK
jgi:hypothetical protein